MLLFLLALKPKHRTERKVRRPEKIIEQEKRSWYESNSKEAILEGIRNQ